MDTAITRLRARLAGVPAPVWAVVGLVAVYIAVFGTLTWRQQSNFGTFGFDMGIYDQGLWLVSRGEEPFVTIRGLNYFAHHVNPITLLFVPAYWLGAGPHFLYLVETIWMALGAVPVFLLARHRLEHPWLAVVLAGAFLLYPSLQWINWWHFHPDALIITPLLFAYWFGVLRRWRWFALAVAVALLCKEDAALAVFVLGLLLAWRGDRRASLATAATGVVWFVICTRVIIPAAGSGEGPFYGELFPGYGESVDEIAWNMVRHPSRVVEQATEPDRLDYYRMLLAPVAFLPLAGLPVLMIGGPQALVNVVSGHSPTHDIRYHYTAIVIAAVFLATIEAIGWLGRRRMGVRRFLVGAVAATALATNVAWSPSPLGVKFRSGIWASAQPKHDAANRALALVPDGAGVSAIYWLAPHLTHRRHIYEFPNPWIVANWGIRGENPPDPDDVDWLVLDTTLLGEQTDLYDELTGPGGDFDVVFEDLGVVVARRR